jgi:hypothetical protein
MRSTEGNPLFVDEMLRLIEAQGGLQSNMPIPDGVRGAIRERLSLLQLEPRAILEVGAVAGREFSLAIVSDAVER